MNDLLKINFDTEQPTVSARDLHEQLHIKTAFKDWFPRIDVLCGVGGKHYGRKEKNDRSRTESSWNQYD